MADRREALLRQIFDVNRQTIDEGRNGSLKAILVPTDRQQDVREAGHLVERLILGGVDVYRADASFNSGGDAYAAGTYVIPMTQVFARYAKDLLEKQTYPEARRDPQTPNIELPYDVTAWSLGMLLGVDVDFVTTPLPTVRMTRVNNVSRPAGRVSGSGTHFVLPYTGPDTAIAINRLLKDGARLAFEEPSQVSVDGMTRDKLEPLAREFGLTIVATDPPPPGVAQEHIQPIRAPRIGLYYPWTGGNSDEGWTRWVLEQDQFAVTTIHNNDVREGSLHERFDTIILPDQTPREMIDGFTANTVRPEFRGGIGDLGVDHLMRFVAEGGTLITLGSASDFVIDRFPIPIRDLKRGLRREQHFAPGTILRIQVDTSNPVGYGMARNTYGFYDNSPFFALLDGFNSLKPTVIARYPNQDIVASGWLRGEDLMAGRAAVVSVDLKPGRVVLFGLRPQHRGQTHATFPMLFNSLYLSATSNSSTN